MKNLGKLSLAAVLVSLACGASAGELYSSDKGTVSMSGDVEHNIFYHVVDAGIDEVKQDGRVRLDFAGERTLEDGTFAKFDVEALADNDGIGDDNAYFKFGVTDSWDITTGRFEATNMFPTGQDTYMDDSNQYQMEFARGRSNNGAIMVTAYAGGLTAEVNITAQDDKTFAGKDGYSITDIAGQNSSNPVWVRPVVSYTGGKVTVAAGMEASINTEDSPVGYAFKFTYADDGIEVNAAAARATFDGGVIGDWDNDTTTAETPKDFDLTNTSYTLNATINGLGIGLFYTTYEDDDNANTDFKQSEAYVSYKITSVMGMDNFEVYPAVYVQNTDYDGATADKDEGGLKIRLKYYF